MRIFRFLFILVFALIVGYTGANIALDATSLLRYSSRVERLQQELEERDQIIKQLKQELGVEQVVKELIFCESEFAFNRHGDLTRSIPVYGIGQFQRRTFYWMADKAGFDGMNWKNPKDQWILVDWAIRNGYGDHWLRCYHKAVRNIETGNYTPTRNAG